MPIIVSTTSPSASNVEGILNRALRLLGQIPPGGSGTDEELDDCLVALNAMIGTWRNDGLMCYARQDETLDLVAAQSEYTLGVNGDLDTTRPVVIDKAWIVSSNSTYNVRILTDEEYAAIPDKTATSTWPDKINYKATMELGTIVVHPVPDAASELHLLTRVVLETLSLADTIALPPGWEEAFASNLAIRLAPEYETTPRAEVVEMAKESKAGIKRVNSTPIKATTELAGMFGGSRTNIITG